MLSSSGDNAQGQNSPLNNDRGNDRCDAPVVDPVPGQLDCFAEYCRFFYRSATSLEKTGTENESQERPYEVAKMVLGAFDKISTQENITLNETSDSSGVLKAAILSCGLDDHSRFQKDPSLLAQYVTVRSQQRSLVHKEQMNIRTAAFYEALRQAEKNSFSKLTEQTLRHFVQKYYKNIGTHSFLTGFRSALEKQATQQDLATSMYCLSWTFDVGVITESCYASQGNTYINDALTLLSGVFRRLSKDGEVMITFAMLPDWSNAELRQLQRCLPDARSLDTRPTGTFTVTGCQRNIDPEAKESIEDVCSLFHWVTSHLFGCFKVTEQAKK